MPNPSDGDVRTFYRFADSIYQTTQSNKIESQHPTMS